MKQDKPKDAKKYEFSIERDVILMAEDGRHIKATVRVLGLRLTYAVVNDFSCG